MFAACHQLNVLQGRHRRGHPHNSFLVVKVEEVFNETLGEGHIV